MKFSRHKFFLIRKAGGSRAEEVESDNQYESPRVSRPRFRKNLWRENFDDLTPKTKTQKTTTMRKWKNKGICLIAKRHLEALLS
jgi:hypothetical protein